MIPRQAKQAAPMKVTIADESVICKYKQCTVGFIYLFKIDPSTSKTGVHFASGAQRVQLFITSRVKICLLLWKTRNSLDLPHKTYANLKPVEDRLLLPTSFRRSVPQK